jgi:hypothetical protein
MSFEMEARMETILGYVTEESKIDYVGFWQVLGYVDRIFRPVDSKTRKRLVLEAIRIILRRGLEAVDLASGAGCTPWPDQNPDAVIKRIAEEWAALGHDPNPAEGVWFHDPNLKPVD